MGSKQNDWQARQEAAGRCRTCGRKRGKLGPRGKGATNGYCASCAEKIRTAQRELKRRQSGYYERRRAS